MITFLNIFKKKNNISSKFDTLKRDKDLLKIFDAINKFSENSEIRFVGGCVRKILGGEKIDDIDLATNLKPPQVEKVLNENNIKTIPTGIEHGTITAINNNKKFEITSLRKDIKTDGRKALVEFTDDWYEDACRRDFTINSIYADLNGNLYDPFDGKKDLNNGEVKFIGDEQKRIHEDYLRILRYLRFFSQYSKKKHKENTKRFIKENLKGIKQISSERLFDEFKKIYKSNLISTLVKDMFCLEILKLIFPQFVNIEKLKDLKNNNVHFDIIISFLVLDDSDNADYFNYKFNLSNKLKRKIEFLKKIFFKREKKFQINEKNLNKILYFDGKESVVDVLDFERIRNIRNKSKIVELYHFFSQKNPPVMPLKANLLMKDYKIPEGKELGEKLKRLEKKWVDNNFNISNKEIQKILDN